MKLADLVWLIPSAAFAIYFVWFDHWRARRRQKTRAAVRCPECGARVVLPP